MQQSEDQASIRHHEAEPPRSAFQPLPDVSGFTALAGPYEICLDDGLVRLGFQVEHQHCNPSGACHGGALATLLDTQLAIAGRVQAKVVTRFLLTVTLSIDYMDAPLIGDWVVAHAEVLRCTRNMVFMQGVATTRGAVLARASGVFRLGPEMAPDNIITRLAQARGLA